MNSHPLLSVVVPTHNRSQYAISCLEAVLSIERSDLQLVVSDTSTDGKLHHMLRNERPDLFSDPRLVFNKINSPSNLTKNNNDAMALATGEYVCLIGDDDCITSFALDAAQWASRHDVDVVSQTVSSNYAWPDFRSRLAGSGHAGKLYVPRRVGTPTRRSAQRDLQRGLNRAFQGTDEMPRCYHGVVKRALLEQIHSSTGAYFHGSSPDMSGAVSLACIIDEYYEVDLPLTIPGASAGSNSGRSAMNTHKGSLSSESQTSAYQGSDWSAGVPRFFSVENVWAHAGLQTLQRLRPELVGTFNYARLIALARVRHGEYLALTTSVVAELEQMKLDQAVFLEKHIDKEIRRERISRLIYLMKRGLRPTASGGRKHFKKLENIFCALRQLDAYASNWDIDFNIYMKR